MSEPLPPPEQTFFADPAMDRLMGVVMALAAEVFILRGEVRRLTDGQTGGGDDPGDADAFVRRLLGPVLGGPRA